jgi:hypothetical protein
MHSTSSDDTPSHCLNCDTALVGPRCHVCGQARSTGRLTLQRLLHDIPHSVFHVDRGVLPTLHGLFLKPGCTINAYLDGKRARYFNPLTLMMLMAGLNTLLFSVFPLQLSGLPTTGEASASAEALQDGLTMSYRYFSLSLALLLPVIAAIGWLCFLGRDRCFGEHLTIQAFLAGFLSFFGICIYFSLRLLDDSPYVGAVWLLYSLLQSLYYLFAMAAIFWRSGRVWSTLLRALAFVALYTISSTILVMLMLSLFAKLD